MEEIKQIDVNRYFIYLGYNGKNYCGWQVQPNGVSVQQTLEEALFTLLRQPVSVTGAGRTDAGVHARTMVAHFDWAGPLDSLSLLAEKMNRVLPKDIAVYRIVPVRPDAHARFDATSRTYKYYVTTQKDPFTYDLTYKIHGSLDIEAMNRACQLLFEYIDFTSFSKLHTDVKTNNCRIMHACWTPEGTGWCFTITADRFLRNMVRAVVGTLLDVGRGKLSQEGLRQVIEAKDRCKAGTSVPGHALFLTDVTYPEEIFVINNK
ncbi:MAG: tRNA pseudouridine(38-40) synthase TruA [Tannerellaceae bacterium]|nr:tRNA pseudouridine(38-40) synthase TruA [Tannerellaceae bacterium]